MTSKVGCAVESKPAPANEKVVVIVVCHYFTAGNVEGKFTDYVKERSKIGQFLLF